ncbi:MAG: MoaD/ThiS family protein [Acidiferrobacterales bacterium]
MSIKVKYFASIREALGRNEDVLAARPGMTVEQVWQIAAHYDVPANTIVAVNEEFSDWQQSVSDGDEVAFFPPVTGG